MWVAHDRQGSEKLPTLTLALLFSRGGFFCCWRRLARDVELPASAVVREREKTADTLKNQMLGYRLLVKYFLNVIALSNSRPVNVKCNDRHRAIALYLTDFWLLLTDQVIFHGFRR